MDEIVFPESYDGVTTDDLTSLRSEANAALLALVEADSPTDEDVVEATRLGEGIDAINVELAARATHAAERAEKIAALREKFSEVEPEEETEEEAETEGDPAEVEAEVVEEVAAATKPSARTTLARRTPRPKPPENTRKPVTITAAADVPDYATGSALDMAAVGQATINRMRGFGTPTGDGKTVNLQHYGVASFNLDFPAELTIDRHSDDMEVLNYAANEHRLPGGSLVAAAGWCAPSEVIYDLCPGASTDGMVSLPEVNVARGGIKYTRGPDFSALYDAGFCFTEAEVIAGVTKPCFEVPCPPFVEVRLDACGICVKVPILQNAAYPEVTNAFLSEAMVGHQHAMNSKVLAKMASLSGAPIPFTGLGSSSGDTLEALLLASANMRQKYRLPLASSLEVVVPFWARDVLLADLYRRNGCCGTASDAEISSIFSAARVNVQFVYDWEELPDAATAWPDTIPALVYPAGAYVKGTSSVISLNAVYDAASLAQNIFTGLFFEQGILVAEMCRDGVAIEIPVCNAGRTGAADLTCATTP